MKWMRRQPTVSPRKKKLFPFTFYDYSGTGHPKTKPKQRTGRFHLGNRNRKVRGSRGLPACCAGS